MVEKKYEIKKEVYEVLVEFEYNEEMMSEERLSYQHALLDVIYLEKNAKDIHGK